MWLLHKNTGDSLKDVYLPLMVVIKKEQLMGCLYMIQSLKEKKKDSYTCTTPLSPCGSKCGGCQSLQSPSGAGQESLRLFPSPLVFTDTISMQVCCPCFNVRAAQCISDHFINRLLPQQGARTAIGHWPQNSSFHD